MPDLEPCYKVLGKRVRELRERVGMNQSEIAEDIGLTRTSSMS